MKKFVLFLPFFLFITCLSAFSQDEDFVIPKNQPVTIQADDGTLIIATDVYSRKSELKRNIRMLHPKTNELIGEVFIRLESSDAGIDLYETLKENPGKFTGTLIIESEGIVYYTKEIVNGVAEPTRVVTERTAGELTGGPCNLNNIHNCVSYRIEEMSWWRFGLCLLSAPACYARQWAYCTFEACINHVQYNPN